MSTAAGRTSPGRLVSLGEIVGTHGVGGLLRFHPYSDAAAALTPPRTVYLQPRPAADTAGWEPRRLLAAKPHGKLFLLQFEGLGTIEAASPLIGTVLAVSEHDLPAAAPNEFYAYQLEG